MYVLYDRRCAAICCSAVNISKLIMWQLITTGKYKVSVVVIDGVTIGHPCCSVHNCHIPLSKNRDRYCKHHQDSAGTCAIIGCSTPIVSNSKTCADKDHQAIEKIHMERGQSRFQLQERLTRARVAHPNDSLGKEVTNISELADVDEDNEEFELLMGKMTSTQANHTSGLANSQKKKVRAQFGRKRTHNEQIIVAPCGMIMARETFFGAEAVSSVVVSDSLLVVIIYIRARFLNVAFSDHF
jgi:hypothetical protein